MNKYDLIKEPLVANYISGLTVGDLALKYKIKTANVYYILRKYYKIIRPREKINEYNILKLYKLYKFGYKLDYLSDIYKISRSRLYRLLNSVEISNKTKETIISLHNLKLTNSQIAQQLHLTSNKIKEILDKYIITKRESILKNYNLTVNEVKQLTK